MIHTPFRLAHAALACLLGASLFASAQQESKSRTQALLLSAPAWIVRWSPPDETRDYLVTVRFRLEAGALLASTTLADGSRCYPDIRVTLQDDGFLFHGCTGVPKEMRHDPADAAVPFKGRAFGFSYRWMRADQVEQSSP